MNRNDVVKLLAMVTVMDGKEAGEAEASAWLGLLGDLRFDECAAQITRHYKASRFRVMPADIRNGAIAARQDTAMRALPAGPDEHIPMPDWFWTTVEQHKLRQRAVNDQRKGDALAPTYGDTVMRPMDGRP